MKDNPTKEVNKDEEHKLHISQFPKETQDFIHQLCANAIKRAINNGTYETNINKGSMK